MSRGIALVTLCLLGSLTAATAADVVTTKVIGSEFVGKYKHPASFTELDNGDLYLAYYGGDGEYEENSKVWGMRRVKGSDAWTTPVVIADTPFLGEGNPVVWQGPDGTVWLFYNQRYGDSWSEARIKGKISTDGAHTWSDSFVVAYELGMMARGRPILLNNGNYLLPIYYETGDDREMTAADTSSLFVFFDPKTKKWTESGRIVSSKGNLQPAPVQMTDDHLIAYCRRGGNFEPVKDGYIIRSESHDGGKTWSRGEDTAFANPNSAVDFIKLQNGHLLLIYNDSMVAREKLTVAISTDSDKTYPHKLLVGPGDKDYAYPVALQAKDGTIHIIYTQDERATVMHAEFSEDAVLKAK